MTVDLRAPIRPDVAPIQRRTLRLLFVTQIIGGVGVAIGISVGALLAARVAGTAVAGLAQSAGVVGAALLAVPVTRIMNGHGRRPGLVVAYLVGAVGGAAGGARRGHRWGAAALPRACCCSAAARRPTSRPATRRWTSPSRPAGAGNSPWSSGPPPSARWRHPTSPRWPTGSPGGWGLPSLSGPFAFSAVAFGAGGGRTAAAAAAGSAAHRAAARGGRRRGRRRRRDRRAAGDGHRAGRARVGMRAAWRVVRAATGRPAGHRRRRGRPPGDGRGDGDDSGTPRRVALRRGRAAGRRHRAEPAHRRHVRPLPGGGLAHRPAGPPRGDPRRGRRCCWPPARWPAPPGTTRRGSRSAWPCSGWAGRRPWWPVRRCCPSRCRPAVRPSVQGLSDLTMGLAGAGAAAASGFVMRLAGYPTLTLLAAIAVVPLVALALRPVPPTAPDEEE